MVDMILFPSSYFHTRQVDTDLQQEYDAAASTGLFKLVLFGYEPWFHGGQLFLSRVPEEMHQAVYRGWMMKPEQYSEFYNQLLDKNIKLVTDPTAYAQMHIFPNIYPALQKDTARLKTYPLHKQIDVERLKAVFPRFMVKDFVKSVKGTDFPQFFDQTITQQKFDSWMDVFYQYRGELLTGGICIKEYLKLKVYGNRTNEWRVFYINHKIATVCRNSGQNIFTPAPPQELLEKYRNLNSPYYTVDYAELADGSWRILEAGDGEVSGLSDHQDYTYYFRALYSASNEKQL